MNAASHRPLISVVIPAYNAQAYLRQAIDSVLAQTFKDFELIVVNDAATDGTADILREYEKTGKVKVVVHERNRGLAAARNSGIRVAKGQYVSFLDADDVWRPEKLEFQMRVLRDNPQIVALCSEELIWHDGEPLSWPPLPERVELRMVDWQQMLLGSSPLSSSNAIIEAESLRRAGMYDERLRAAEDRDLWLRLLELHPQGVALSSGAVDAYRKHESNMSAIPAHMKPNMKMVLRKTFERVPCGWSLRARAYANLYFDIAVTAAEAGRRAQALLHLLISLLVWPFSLGRATVRLPLIRWIWALRAVLGAKVFHRLIGRAGGNTTPHPRKI